MTDIERLEQFKDDLETIIALNRDNLTEDTIIQALKETIEDISLCKVIMHPLEFNKVTGQYEINFKKVVQK